MFGSLYSPEHSLSCPMTPGSDVDPIVQFLTPPHESRKPKPSVYELSTQIQDLKREALSNKRTLLKEQVEEAKQRVRKLEYTMCTHRNQMAGYSDFLKRERLRMNEILMAWIGVDEEAEDLYKEYALDTRIDTEQSLCDSINKVANRYPQYQIKTSNNMGQAVDNALCTLEVAAEDIIILKEKITKVKELMSRELDLRTELKNTITQFSLLSA